MDQVIRTKYVLGFMFSEDRTRVALVRKNRPLWQKDHLNGIGGHIEKGELPWDAMKREFLEETGVLTGGMDYWREFAEMILPDAHVYCFMADAWKDMPDIQTMTNEMVQWYSLDYLQREKPSMIENLKWLIPLGASRECLNVVVTYHHSMEDPDACKRPAGTNI